MHWASILGYLIDSKGLHPTPAKVRAMQQALPPKNKAELQAFLGLLNFYNIFLPHKATIVEPLHRLLDSRTPWDWNRRVAALFQAVKDLLTSDSVLMQYHAELPLTLAYDASPYGVGDTVYAQNFGGDPRWLPGHIAKVTGPCSYLV